MRDSFYNVRSAIYICFQKFYQNLLLRVHRSRNKFFGNLPRNYLSVFDHFVGLALNRLINLFHINKGNFREKHKINITITSFNVLTDLERWCITLFSQLALLFQLYLHYFRRLIYSFRKQKLPSHDVSMAFAVENCFPALFHIICASNAENSITTIILLCTSLFSMTLYFSKKVPSKVLYGRD